MDSYVDLKREADIGRHIGDVDSVGSDLDQSTRSRESKWNIEEESSGTETLDNKVLVPASGTAEDEEEPDLEPADIKAEPESESGDYEGDVIALPAIPYDPRPGYYMNPDGSSVSPPWPQGPYSGTRHDSYNAVASSPTSTSTPTPTQDSSLSDIEYQLQDPAETEAHASCRLESIKLRLTHLDKQLSIVSSKLREERSDLAFSIYEWEGNSLDDPSPTELIIQMLEQRQEQLAADIWNLEGDKQSLLFRFPGLGDGYKASSSRRRCRGCCMSSGEEGEDVLGHRYKRARR
ncbi:hypothetical protein HD806DRAFT_545981 [Xylariaceae sp. AK1471]|nr:hypothetical protein HD806DRAFT_545981 [Xylariaceae sp. AK1471]